MRTLQIETHIDAARTLTDVVFIESYSFLDDGVVCRDGVGCGRAITGLQGPHFWVLISLYWPPEEGSGAHSSLDERQLFSRQQEAQPPMSSPRESWSSAALPRSPTLLLAARLGFSSSGLPGEGPAGLPSRYTADAP